MKKWTVYGVCSRSMSLSDALRFENDLSLFEGTSIVVRYMCYRLYIQAKNDFHPLAH